ncbi:TVP38/TMEM64 family protein [Acuticoccus kandeliae]|uniref:TVP38/TMEM64 family protein n=1 Tax=Acuticoccus kandeliae TaxID=2073160 RepID=UPI001FE4F8D6|nr:TVP38/TMEM64 family protein [Acuticoccus kandeliae]
MASSQVPARPWWRRLLPLAVVGAAMVLFYVFDLHEHISLQEIIRRHEKLEALERDRTFMMVFAYLALYVLAVAVSFPGASLLTILGGLLFGPVLATLLTVVAATAGGAIIFLAAKTSLGAMLRARAGRFSQRLAEGFEADAFSYLLFLRLIPLFPFWLINVAPALFNVSLRTFVAATAIGIVPGTFAYALLGSGLKGVIKAQERANPGCADAGTCKVDLGALFSPGLIAAIVLLSLVALVPVFWKRWRTRNAAA